jgi:hypothetical protein
MSPEPEIGLGEDHGQSLVIELSQAEHRSYFPTSTDIAPGPRPFPLQVLP